MYMLIDKLLNYSFEYENVDWYTFEELRLNYFDTIKGLNINDYEDTKLRVYMYDECYDQRSREINVLEYKGIPFYLYQYVGKGYVENETVINAEVMKEFMFTHIQKALNSMLFNEEDGFNLETYSAKLFIEDNKIITRNI